MPTYPGDPTVSVAPALTIADDGASVHRLRCGTHTGTHIDAPAHLDSAGATLGERSIDRFVSRRLHETERDLVAVAEEVIEGREDDEIKALPDAVANSLDQLHQAATALRKWRSEHALLSGDRPEFRLRLDENKRIRLIEPSVQNEAHRLVEECMVAANRCAADFLINQTAGLMLLRIDAFTLQQCIGNGLA